MAESCQSCVFIAQECRPTCILGCILWEIVCAVNTKMGESEAEETILLPWFYQRQMKRKRKSKNFGPVR